jgi:hypothetical protein
VGALRARTAARGLLRVPARPLPHKPSVRNRGRVVGGGSWLDGPTFRRRHFRLENSVRARTRFRRPQGLSAATPSISQAVVEPAVRLPAPADVTNYQSSAISGVSTFALRRRRPHSRYRARSHTLCRVTAFPTPVPAPSTLGGPSEESRPDMAVNWWPSGKGWDESTPGHVYGGPQLGQLRDTRRCRAGSDSYRAPQ